MNYLESAVFRNLKDYEKIILAFRTEQRKDNAGLGALILGVILFFVALMISSFLLALASIALAMGGLHVSSRAELLIREWDNGYEDRLKVLAHALRFPYRQEEGLCKFSLSELQTLAHENIHERLKELHDWRRDKSTYLLTHCRERFRKEVTAFVEDSESAMEGEIESANQIMHEFGLVPDADYRWAERELEAKE